MYLVLILLQTLSTVLFSIGGFFLGTYTSDQSDIELYRKFSKTANHHSNLPPTRHGVTMILSQAYRKEADTWKSAVETKEKIARKNLFLGITCLIIGSILLILSLFLDN